MTSIDSKDSTNKRETANFGTDTWPNECRSIIVVFRARAKEMIKDERGTRSP